MKKYIAIDFDDVIAETFEDGFLPALNKWQEDKYHDWKIEDFTTWDAAHVTGVSKDTIADLFDGIDYTKVLPVNDSLRIIRNLIDQGHSVHVLTANKKPYKIREWMFTNGLADVPLASTPWKVMWMLDRGFDVIIDDNPETLRTAAAKGLSAIRFNRPWNMNMNWGSGENEWGANDWRRIWLVLDRLSFGERPADFFGERSPDQRAWDEYQNDKGVKLRITLELALVENEDNE
jgi:5'(3')-deoxyribonucleotidase